MLARILVWLAAAWATAGAALAEPRIALVVGIGAYQGIGTLENPVRDARLMAEKLQGLGFEVMLLPDATLAEFREGVAVFGRKLRAGGPEATGLFYYAGHGVQSFGNNYLLPADAAVTNAADLDLVGIEAQSILRQMSSARNRTNIVILDACRNNPFVAIRDLNDNGLAEMKAPTGTFLAYATAPQDVALDGLDGNSPFTQALARMLPEPGVPIEQMFKQVRVSVLEATGGRQTPWDTSSLTADFYFVPSKPLSPQELEELQLWNSVRASRDPVQVMLFMRSYPEGRYAEEARSLLAEVMANELAAARPAPSPAPAPVPVPVPVTPAPAGPTAAEQAAFAAAAKDNSAAAWEAFLRAYPASLFREMAEVELAAVRAARPRTDTTPPPPAHEGTIAYAAPLAGGTDAVRGRSIEQLAQGAPLYSPIEGLPDAAWKDRGCSGCHKWSKPALCDQGKFYVANNVDDGLGAVHPYGGEFRRVLKAWAAQGCN